MLLTKLSERLSLTQSQWNLGRINHTNQSDIRCTGAATTTPRPKKPQRALAVRLLLQIPVLLLGWSLLHPSCNSHLLPSPPHSWHWAGWESGLWPFFCFLFFLKACPVVASSVQLLSLWFAPKQLEYIHNDLFFLTAAMISRILTNFCETVMIECRNGLINDSFSHFGYSESVSCGSLLRVWLSR